MHGPVTKKSQKKLNSVAQLPGSWKYALESRTVDAVLVITKGTDLYDARPGAGHRPDRTLQRPQAHFIAVPFCCPRSSRNSLTVQQTRKSG